LVGRRRREKDKMSKQSEKRDEGVSALEYILIVLFLAVIILLCAIFFSSKMDEKYVLPAQNKEEVDP
jgi:hypothetical protein